MKASLTLAAGVLSSLVWSAPARAGTTTVDLISPSHCTQGNGRLSRCSIPTQTLTATDFATAVPMGTVVRRVTTGNCATRFPGPRILRFHVSDWSLDGTLSGPVPGSRHAAFSPDGGLLAVTKYGVLVLGVDEGTRVFRYEVDNDFYATLSSARTGRRWRGASPTAPWGIASPS